jgi:hypothetical protein
MVILSRVSCFFVLTGTASRTSVERRCGRLDVMQGRDCLVANSRHFLYRLQTVATLIQCHHSPGRVAISILSVFYLAPIVVGIVSLMIYNSIPTEGNVRSLLVSYLCCQRRQLLGHTDHRIRAKGRPLAPCSNKITCHPLTSTAYKMPPFECIACLETFTSAAEFKTHKRECRANRLAYLKIRAIRLDPKGKCSNS